MAGWLVVGRRQQQRVFSPASEGELLYRHPCQTRRLASSIVLISWAVPLGPALPQDWSSDSLLSPVTPSHSAAIPTADSSGTVQSRVMTTPCFAPPTSARNLPLRSAARIHLTLISTACKPAVAPAGIGLARGAGALTSAESVVVDAAGNISVQVVSPVWPLIRTRIGFGLPGQISHS